MLYDDDMSDDEKTFVVGVHRAPDREMQRERANGEYIGLVRNVAVDYPTLDHETTLRDQHITMMSRHAQAPTVAMLDLAGLERQRRKILQGGTAAAAVGSGPLRVEQVEVAARPSPSKLSFMDIHSQAHKSNNRRVDAAEIAADESVQDTVFKGPPHLYREPRITSKLAAILMHSKVDSNTFDGITTSSQPVPIMRRPMTSGSTEFGMERARRDCCVSLAEIVNACHEGGGSSFVDVPFFQGARSNIYPVGTSSDSRVSEPQDVKRATDMFPLIPLFDRDISSKEPLQWITASGCRSTHIVAALSALTLSDEGRSWIESLLVFLPSSDCETASEFFSRYRCIGVLLYVNGLWEWTIVDDLLAISGPSQPSFVRLTSTQKMFVLQTNFEPLGLPHGKINKVPHRFRPSLEDYLFPEDDPAELWPYLLSKAITKVYGCVDAIDGGVPRRILRMLTGREAIGVSLRSSMTSDTFTELVEDRSALVWMLDRQPSAKFHHDDRTGCVLLDTLTSCEPAWLPTELPLVVERCFHSTEDVSPMVRLKSPWGSLRASGECTVDLHWEEFIRYFSYAEICAAKNAKQHHHVEASNVSPHPVDGGTINGNSLPESTQDPPPSLSQIGPLGIQYVLRLDSPLPTPLAITLLQSNPQVHKGLTYSMRKGIPYAALGLRVVSHSSGEVEYLSQAPHVDEELTIEIVLNPGMYIITPFFYNCPKVPFCVRAAASSLTQLRMWPVGLDPEVHGVATQPCHTQKIEDVPLPPNRSVTPRREQIVNISNAASAAFRQVDLLSKGVLSTRAAQQAALIYFMENTEQGKKLALELNGDPEQEVSEAQFSKVMNSVFPPM